MNQIAKDLLSIKAVFLSPTKPFTWASGIKSPIYCDNRLTLSYPKVRKDVEQGLAQLVKDNFPAACPEDSDKVFPDVTSSTDFFVATAC